MGPQVEHDGGTTGQAGRAGLGRVRRGAGVSRRTVLSALATLGAIPGIAGAASALTPPTGHLVGTGLPRREATVARFAGRVPQWFGLEGPGVVSSFASPDQVVLTYDACGGPSLEYDAALIEVLRRHQAPATLFVNRQWALANWRLITELHDDPLFEIANHGDRHVPLGVAGQAAYGIPGTADVGAAYDEIARTHRLFRMLWDHEPHWFRPGTAHVDDVGADLAQHLGTPVVGFSVNADLGATQPADAVRDNLLALQPGGIALAHMNRPGSGTAAGTDAAIPLLRERGLRLARLGDVL